jgi:acrylyl-CoA reductase (NADPH)
MTSTTRSFKAYRIHQRDGVIDARFESLSLEDLTPGDVVIRVTHSAINYKDALAATGKGRILRRFPLVGGIDLAGVVESSLVARFRAGDAVLATGGDLSETRDGGYAEFARVPAELVVPLPAGFSASEAMAIGTAGVSAAWAIMRMEANGQSPAGGPVVVTGASGGVGSLAVDMLAGRGYRVIAVTGKTAAHDYLRALGASEVMAVGDLGATDQPLLPARWGGAIDNLGGSALARLLAGTRYGGNVASIGLAESASLQTTVMPFILRGVSLLGVNSSGISAANRSAIWQRLGGDLRPRHLDRIVTRTVAFADLPSAFDAYLRSAVLGRTVVRIA